MNAAALPKQLARRALSLVRRPLQEGSTYRKWRRFLNDGSGWNAAQIEHWQAEQLRSMVQYAIDHTEGYRELYRRAGVKPNDLQSTADIRHLPFTTKELFQGNLEAFSVRKLGRKYCTTGGTTGQPVGFYQLRGLLAVERAFVHDAWSQFGWTSGARMAVLRGGFVGTRERPWLWDPYRRELHLSTYHLSKETLPIYAGAVSLYGATILQAFPSAANIFADLVQQTGMAANFPFRSIFFASENFYAWQSAKTASVFPQAKLFDFYGQSERVIFAAWCQHSRQYHANPFYGVTELVESELVGTSFHNFGTPFIRYRTMDAAEAGQPRCEACGRNWQMFPKLLGRRQEQIVTGTGRYISMSAMNMHDRLFDALIQFQFRQERAGEVTFLYLPRAPLSTSQEAQIRRGLMAKLGTDVDLRLEAVAEIPRTKAGKTRMLDQRVPLAYGEADAA